MIYLFDTNSVSYLIEPESERGARIMSRLRSGRAGETAVSVLSLCELTTFVAVKPDFAVLASTTTSLFQVLDVTASVAPTFTRLKLGLAAHSGAKTRVMARHNFDLIIAATAIDAGYTLVSNDSLFVTLAELEPALKLEDWTI